MPLARGYAQSQEHGQASDKLPTRIPDERLRSTTTRRGSTDEQRQVVEEAPTYPAWR